MELRAGKLEDDGEDFCGVLFVLSYGTFLLGNSCEEPFY